MLIHKIQYTGWVPESESNSQTIKAFKLAYSEELNSLIADLKYIIENSTYPTKRDCTSSEGDNAKRVKVVATVDITIADV